MISFEPTEDQVLMRDSVASFAKTTLLPRVRETEKLRAVPDDVRQLAHEMGLGLVAVPEACGGQGLGLTTSVLLEEELGAADAAAPFGFPGPHAFAHAVLELGSEEQASAELTDFSAADAHARFGAVAWSEAKPHPTRAGFTTVARTTASGFEITGKKSFVINAGLADRFVVFAQVDEAAGWHGIGAFLVRRDAAGLTIGARHDTLGLDAAWFGEIDLAAVQVPAAARLTAPRDGEGGTDVDRFVRATARFFARQALVVAARAVGLSRYAWELAREHCETRVAFGKPIGHFQAVAFTLSDRLMDVDSARWLVWRAAQAWDSLGGDGAPAAGSSARKKAEAHALKASAQAAAHALEAAMRCGDDCVGLHGGSGFIRDLVAEKLMRDAKQLALVCPTAEQLDQLATAVELGVPLDPALVLPTPDAQAIFT
ncbi:MAG: acyl-CoA dehydrogenase family protein [Polyangiaceae bacterium]